MSKELRSEKPLLKLSNALKGNKSLQVETYKKLNSNVVFEIHNRKLNKTSRWLLKSKEKEDIAMMKLDGESPGPADISIQIDDNNLMKLMNGKLSAQRLFMTGKLKIKGNITKAGYIETLMRVGGKEGAKL